MAGADKVPVLIVGAGPTGLVLALWLWKKEIPFRIIDKSSSPGETSRALGIQARTLEFYRQLGIDREITTRGITVKEIKIRRGGRLAVRAKLGAMGENVTPYSYVTFLSQDLHEQFLIDELNKLGVLVERNTELIQLTQNNDGVTAKIKSPKGEETLTAQYLCGCDGAHSFVREASGIGFPGGTYNQVFYVADVEAKGEAAQGGLQLSVSREDFCIIMPIEKLNSIRLTGIVPPAVEKKEQIEFEDVAESVKRNTGLTVQKVNWFSSYHVHHRVADQFQKGRVFLAGDAGHIHSPAGAQGMNTGIGDAVNLAWKLADVLSGASPKLLDTYEPERIAFARRLVESTDTAFTLIASRSLVGSLWRAFILPRVFAIITAWKPTLQFMFRLISQTGIRYRKSPLSQGAVGKICAGDRLPWVRFNAGDNFEPLKSLSWQIHIYGDIEPSFRTAAEEAKISAQLFEWNDDARSKGFIKEAFYLIRPDGYVGLASEHQDPARLKKYVEEWKISNGDFVI